MKTTIHTYEASTLPKATEATFLVLGDGLPLLLHDVVQVLPLPLPFLSLVVGLIPHVVPKQVTPQLPPQIGVDALRWGGRNLYNVCISVIIASLFSLLS